MEQNKYTTVQQNLANEAMGLIGLMGEDTTVSDYQRAIRLVGKAHGIPNDTTEEHLKLIESAQNEMHRKCAGEVITEPLITDEIVGNWSALRIHETVMGLFEASIHLEQSGERMALFNVANEILDMQSFEDWIMNEAEGSTATLVRPT